jgi:citrate lyase beta subunit
MLALRSILVIAGDDEAPYAAAATTAADAVLFDLAAPHAVHHRAAARRLVERFAPLAAKAKREVLVRIGDARSGELEADVDAVVSAALSAVVLPGTEAPQDARDADVAIRKREMRRGIAPGTIRLVPEIDSAAGLRGLAGILDAVDRHGAVALDVAGLLGQLGVAARRAEATAHTHTRVAMEDHAMADVALASGTLHLPWLVTGRGASDVATRAHDLGAAGVALAAEAEALGMNALFAPDPDEVAAAHAALEAWERVRARGRWVDAVTARDGERLVDRRTVRLARALIARADAIARRESAR